MDNATDGVIDAVFGVKLVDEHYEAYRGTLEFRGGRLVGIRVGRFPAWEDPEGLTVGFTLLPTLTGRRPGEAGFLHRPAVTRVYVKGALESETEHATVYVNTDRL